MTRKQIIRVVGISLVAIAAVVVAVFAVIGSVTASANEVKMPVCSVDRNDGRVALTFDCAWDASDTDELLELFRNCNVMATFFVTGEFCDAHGEAVRKMAAAGHSIQCASDKNIHIAGCNINDLIADTKEAARKIKLVSGKEPKFYRAPYGDYDDKSLTTLEGMGYIPVQCDIDSKDLDDPDAASVRKRVTARAGAGSILLFHNDCDVTDEALPDIITALKKNGLELVKIDDLVFTDNYTIDSKGVQRYQPAVQTALPIVYCDYNSALDSAFEKMRINLTVQQIYDLSSVGRVGLVDEIKSFLNEEELYAIREATYEELMDCYLVLVYAAENYGAGGTYTDPQPDQVPQIVTSPETTPTPSPDAEIIPEDDSYVYPGNDGSGTVPPDTDDSGIYVK